MKKWITVFAISSAFLTACTNAPVKQQQPQKKAVDPNELPQGIMQPVNGTGAVEGSFGWGTDIQSAPMPDTMK